MKYKPGDRVWLRGKKYVVFENYYPNGYGWENEAAYSIYPPGKKRSYGYHFWTYEKELEAR